MNEDPTPSDHAEGLDDLHGVTHGPGADRLNAALRFIDNPPPMWVYDLATLRIVDVNETAVATFGYSRREMLSKLTTDLWLTRRLSDDIVHIRPPDAALPVSLTRRHRRKNGTPIDVHILTQPLLFAGRSSVLSVALDVTEVRQAADPAVAWARKANLVEALVALITEAEITREASTVLTTLQGLPDGARDLIRRLEIAHVDLAFKGHLTRAMQWSLRLAKAAAVPPARQRCLAEAALLHDVGKLSVSPALLRKRGPLSADERAQIARHVGTGVAMLKTTKVDTAVVEIVAAHHERWDGGGYPDGLAGEAIPLEARILAIADSFDAMTSARAYRPSRTRDEAVAELRREAGRQFDSTLVGVFNALL